MALIQSYERRLSVDYSNPKDVQNRINDLFDTQVYRRFALETDPIKLIYQYFRYYDNRFQTNIQAYNQFAHTILNQKTVNSIQVYESSTLYNSLTSKANALLIEVRHKTLFIDFYHELLEYWIQNAKHAVLLGITCVDPSLTFEEMSHVVYVCSLRRSLATRLPKQCKLIAQFKEEYINWCFFEIKDTTEQQKQNQIVSPNKTSALTKSYSDHESLAKTYKINDKVPSGINSASPSRRSPFGRPTVTDTPNRINPLMVPVLPPALLTMSNQFVSNIFDNDSSSAESSDHNDGASPPPTAVLPLLKDRDRMPRSKSSQVAPVGGKLSRTRFSNALGTLDLSKLTQGNR